MPAAAAAREIPRLGQPTHATHEICNLYEVSRRPNKLAASLATLARAIVPRKVMSTVAGRLRYLFVFTCNVQQRSDYICVRSSNNATDTVHQYS